MCKLIKVPVFLFCIFYASGAGLLLAASAPKEESPFGVCVDLDECKDEKIPRLIKKARIQWIRQQIRWDIIEPRANEFHWEGFDKAIKNEAEYGLNVYGQLHWWKRANPMTGEDEAIKHWTNFVSLAVNRYKDKIKYWEVWNEPDNEFFWKPMNPSNYVKLLKATYIAAKKADPDCKIILGGVMGWGDRYIISPFVDDVYKNGGGQYFDIMAFHPYTMPYNPKKGNFLKQKINDVLKRMKNNKDADKPIWITEIGWPSSRLIDPDSYRPVTPKQQAEYLKYALEICLSYPQIKKVFWYCFKDTGTNPTDSDQHYGLLNYDFKPKPSYRSYKDFIIKYKK